MVLESGLAASTTSTKARSHEWLRYSNRRAEARHYKSNEYKSNNYKIKSTGLKTGHYDYDGVIATFKASRPRYRRDFTVEIGAPVTPAISSSCNSS